MPRSMDVGKPLRRCDPAMKLGLSSIHRALRVRTRVSVRWSFRALAFLLATGVLVASAPPVADAAGPSVASPVAPFDAGAAGPSVVSGAALSGASPAATSAADADTSGCTNQAAKSNFHETQSNQAILPLQQLPMDAVSVPTWSGSFTTDGTSYPFTMVGTDPAAGSVTTHVPVELIPVSLEFQGNGCVLQDSRAIADIEASPLFTAAANIRTGVTQYLDAVQRANFWSTVSTVSPDYHLLLDPSAMPAVTLNVPASQGLTFDDPTCDPVCGIVSGDWFTRKLVGLLGSLHISPTTLAVFVPVNTFITDQNPSACLVSCAAYEGFHQAILSPKNPHAINTFAVADYRDDPEVPAPFDIGPYTLSHEILEWANDPFDNEARVQGNLSFFANPAPAWTSPYYFDSPPCLPIMEVADPLEGVGFLPILAVGSSTIYGLADAAFLSWFARQAPSTSFGGTYDLAGVFSTYSTAC